MKQEISFELPFRIASLAKKHFAVSLTEEEQAELNAWIYSHPELWEEIDAAAAKQWQNDPLQHYDVAAATIAIHQKIRKNKQRRIYQLAAAAVILLCIGVGLRYLKGPSGPAALVVMNTGNDVPPGSTQARLVMANGHTIGLNRDGDSSFTQGKTIQVHQQQGILSFQAKNNTKELPTFNTLITPKGGEYRLVLDDGTAVWLNAASSIRFPNHFLGKRRTVQLSGEAYFEVKHNPQQPFIVEVNGTAIQVLGTAFNIKAYHTETTFTTLLNGAVKVANQVLKPGEMAVSEQGYTTLTEADIEQVMAWKNKQIILRDANIRDVMEELSRWYNVDVQYASDFKGATGITIEINRNVTLSKLLEMIMLTKSAKFKTEGNTVTVMSYR
jgi:transmembrane sensor